jgi:hypothetical protein
LELNSKDASMVWYLQITKKKKKGSPNKSIYKQLKEEKRQEIKQG